MPRQHRSKTVLISLIMLIAVVPLSAFDCSVRTPPPPANQNSSKISENQDPSSPGAQQEVYLPTLFSSASVGSAPRVNTPHFDGEVVYEETSVFWFGAVTANQNYADVRVGYNDSELYVHINVFDRRLWYDTSPSTNELPQWDAVSVYLSTGGNRGASLDSNDYQFLAQFNWWEPRDSYQVAYQGNGSSWIQTNVPFTSSAGWRGNAPNDNTDDRGWTTAFHIPFSSLDLSGPPPDGTLWGLAITVYDRDGETAAPLTPQSWPQGMNGTSPDDWGQLHYGLPVYNPPITSPSGSITIRRGSNAVSTPDAMVGGSTTCGDGLDFWNEWGWENYAGSTDINVQNQSDVADWPCFSKIYISFPLEAMPLGKTILSAQLTMHQFGNSDPSNAQSSLIQVMTINTDWDENTINWNNAPYAWENVSRTWVTPLTSFPGWPGVARNWDVTRAVVDAYQSQLPLRLVLYSADSAYHSGKYFVTSETGDWNAIARPTLTITWGN